MLLDLLNHIYISGEIPGRWNQSTFITIPKKPSAIVCDDYRTISHISHSLKILLKILLTRARNLIPKNISETQFRFVTNSGTSNTVFVIKNISERYVETQNDLHLCFIDYKKAFDKVKHKEIEHILNDLGLDDKDFRDIQNVYFNQTAKGRTLDAETDEIRIENGVRQVVCIHFICSTRTANA